MPSTELSDANAGGNGCKRDGGGNGAGWRDGRAGAGGAYGTERAGSGADRRRSRLRQNALDPGFHCVRTHWIRGFMALQLVRRTRTAVLMVPV
jgi:hypothetical protein